MSEPRSTRLSRLASFGALAATAALFGCATAAPSGQSAAAPRGGQQCFLASQVNGFDAIDDQTVDVTVGVNNVYRLQIVGVCPDIDWTQRIGIRARGGSRWVCRGFDAELIVPSPTGLQTCPVTAVRKLTDEEVKAKRAARSEKR